jgi:hypothetical protein
MKTLRRFDIPAFRTGWAAFNFVAMLTFASVAYWWTGVLGTIAVVVLGVAYSPLAFYYTLADGTFGGFYGWANPLRYIGAIVVVPCLAQMPVSRRAAVPRRDTASGVALGSIWAVTAFFAQENLSSVLVAGGLILVLLWLTRTASGWNIVRLIRNVALGFSAVAIFVLAYYSWHGAAREFISNYFLVPRAVAAGYSNMWWPPQDAGRADVASYYFTFPFLIAIAICTIWRAPGCLQPLDFNRRRLLSFVCVQLACFQTALFRSDASHVMNTLIALPFVLALGVVDVPRFLAAKWPARIVVGAVFVSLVLLIYPTLRTSQWRPLIVAPTAKLRAVAPSPLPVKYGSRVGFRRATRWLADEPLLADSSGLSMREFAEFTSDLHDLVGVRKTYVASLRRVWAGAVYFMADLVPAPFPLDRDTMTINQPLRDRVTDHIRSHPRDYECLISNSLSEQESEAFLATHAAAVITQRQLGSEPVYIILSRPDL